MKQIIAIAKFTIKENISNRLFNAFIGFGLFIMLSTVFLNEISLYEGARVIYESGLFLIEFFVLLISIFTSATLVLKDTKEKSIYLVLTKPVTRNMYILGKVLGLIVTVFLNVAIMGGILFGILVFQKAQVDIKYMYALIFIFYKLSIIIAIGVLFSVLSDSVITANIFTLSIYILGHAVYELKMLADKMNNILIKSLLEAFYRVLPNFRVLNYRDYLQNIEIDFGKMTLYVVGYIMIVVVITNLIFKNKRI
ncbi:MAG: hypothetical protein B6I28_04650 [Fusobacteriia bacterium 4572_132]|nr:MAG: hypothetical protein B6I28_04650 [Fusobacteriia bacterium 4572_132]